jgi:hypothetical protein
MEGCIGIKWPKTEYVTQEYGHLNGCFFNRVGLIEKFHCTYLSPPRIYCSTPTTARINRNWRKRACICSLSV